MSALTVGVFFLFLTGVTSDVFRMPLKRYGNLKKILRQESKILEEAFFIAADSSLEISKRHARVDYFGEMSVGTPPQKFTAFFVQFCSDLVIPSVNGKKSCEKHRGYDSSKSSTYVANGTEVSYSLPSGDISGILSTDDVEIAGLKIKNITFGEITDYKNSSFDSKNYDVYFCLGANATGIGGARSPLYTMHDQKLIDSLSYSVYLTSKEGSDVGGTIVFGGIDTSLYNGSINYMPLSSESEWEFIIDIIAIEEESFCEKGCRIIAETSVPAIIGPRGTVDKVMAAVGAKTSAYGTYYVNCTSVPTLPAISFVMGDVAFSLEPKYYVQPPGDKRKDICTMSILGLYYMESHPWVLGKPFFEKYYAVFDVEKQRIGFATANH